ncbi:hypothetical protein YPPY55_2120, partial [Yersinia pestis PY-55]
MAKQT